MARVTVEDCVKKIPNRFDLVLLAAGRAKALFSNAKLKLTNEEFQTVAAAIRAEL